MKDQLKKTFRDASRHIPTKIEEVIKAKDTFLTEDFSQITIEQGFNTEQEYNLFRSTNRQQTYDLDLNTYYNRGNYHKYNRRNNISRHYQQQPKVRSTQNNMKQIQETHNEKIHVIETGIQLKMSHIQKHLPYGPELPREVRYSIHKSCSLPI